MDEVTEAKPAPSTPVEDLAQTTSATGTPAEEVTQTPPIPKTPAEELEDRANALRASFADNPAQINDILGLYGKYIELGQTFPIDLEAQSLRLILKFLRPHDEKAAGRLSNLLRQLGEPVPAELVAIATRYNLSTPEVGASERRAAAAVIRQKTPEAPQDISERLIFVFGLPKSASRLFVKVLSAVQGFGSPAIRPYSTGSVGLDAVSDLRFEAFRDFDGGGILHSHASASYATRFTLGRLSIGHLITVRHPADHISALFCHILKGTKDIAPAALRRYLNSYTGLPAGRDPDLAFYTAEKDQSHLFHHPVIFPTDVRFFIAPVDVDKAMAHMINDGYLYYALSWMVEWQLFRLRTRSALIRYEDFIDKPRETIAQVSTTLFGAADEAAIERGLSVFSAGEVSPDHAVDPKEYPRGYTGSRGIWRNYLSVENQRAYNRVCEGFLSAHPYGQLLADLYDDLLIAAGPSS